MQDPGLIMLIMAIMAMTVFLLTLVRTDAAIVLLIFSMLLSPEISLAQLPKRAVVVRFDDMLLAVIFFTWLAKLAINKQVGLIRNTPMNLPLIGFIVSCVISTGWGIVNGTVAKPLESAFYLLKYLEYFLLYFMIASIVRERRQIELFFKAMICTAIIVCVNAYAQMAMHGIGYRVTAPFEGAPEPNTLAGYLLIIISACLGLAVYTRSTVQRVSLLGLVVFMLPPFVLTYSRGGYVAFLAMYLTVCLLSSRYRGLLLGALLIGIMAAPMIFPRTVFLRVASTFDPRGAVTIGAVEGVGGVRLSASPAARVFMWRKVYRKWREHPLIGFGVTGVGGLTDNQYARVLGELGIFGVFMYLWVRWRLLIVSFRNFRATDDPLARGLTLGFLAGFIGLMVHSFAGDIFIIVRIMEPFWFLAAIVVILPTLAEQTDGSVSDRTPIPTGPARVAPSVP